MTDLEQTGPRCPFCGSCDVELFSLFGQQLMTVQYYCNACRTPFEHIKGEDILAEARRHSEADAVPPVSKPGYDEYG